MTLPPIAVIGAGFSGTMAALHLSRLLPERPVLLCEKSGAFARGLAYATACPDHLLNVRATNMSAFPDRPDHFSRWLESCPVDGVAWTRSTPAGLFAARGLYGRYLTDLLLAALSAPGQAPRLMLENDEVVDLAPADEGFCLTLAAGRRRMVAGAILACGNLRAPPGPRSRYAVDPWDGSPLDDLRPDLPLLIVGTGLTMVDAVAALRQRGFAGPILAVSRRGLLPQVHAATVPWPAPDVPAAARGSLTRLLRVVRDEVRRAAAAGVDWRSVIDALRGASIDLWRGLPLAEQRRFLRHVRAFWDVHRHRMAPPAAEIIGRELAGGGLTLMRARVVAVEDQAGQARVTLRARGAAELQTVEVQRIIDASGVARVADTEDLLLRRLMGRGLIRPDVLGLGLSVADDLAVVDQRGDASRPLWTLGPLLRGTLWECTAVPDIRGQAADLARRVATRLQEAAPGAERVLDETA
ncbi:FAD/NAD(P)-binding protein [Methylobacterium nonmethylotrophicum]|uniref:Pyridine nucleotide-disulfide oxidoreductase n=1 Tax=Methylobacterium nonmethylotrophicum TaxID=1141884 RepID=A0A4Z0NJQ8_9HYPH|nr:FAD/NAD(P)-binding protein [Methylobacterium nonmethylotrophicum]TGD95834.1 pyridine nucleotide-disulfide oxidoreductase [Methylobacterium nonmethylotrophicum]